MRRRGLLLLTLLSLSLTVTVQALLAKPAGRRPALVAQARAQDTLSSEALCRFRQGQPHHWRACLLQRN